MKAVQQTGAAGRPTAQAKHRITAAANNSTNSSRQKEDPPRGAGNEGAEDGKCGMRMFREGSGRGVRQIKAGSSRGMADQGDEAYCKY